MTRRLSWPLTLDGGDLVTNEQDGLNDVAQCVHLLRMTPLGNRPLSPEVGFDDPTEDDPTEAYGEQLQKWEPRASLDVTEQRSDDGRDLVRRVRVSLADNPDTTEAR